MQITAGSTDVSISIYARSSTGAALTGKVAADFALTYRRAGANVSISLSNLTALTDAHTDGGILEVGNGEYRLDLPDASCAAGVNQVSVGGTVAGGVVLGYPIALTSTTGVGPHAVTITVDDGATPTPAKIEGARVSLTKGAIVRTGTTSALGDIAFGVDAGTWTLAITADGYNQKTATLVVGAAIASTQSLVATTSTPSTRPGTVTVRWTVIDDADYLPCGAGEGTMQIRLKAGPGTAGFSWGKDARSATTDANGVVQFTEVPQGCTLLAKLGASTSAGEWFEVTIASDATSPYDAGEILGSVP